MSVDSKVQTGLALAATALLGGVAMGLYQLRTHDTRTLEDGTVCATHVSVDWPGGVVPQGAVCKTSEIVGPSEAWSALGLCPDGKTALARICGVPAEVADDNVGLPAGVSVISDPTDEATPYTSGPALEVWDARHPDASSLYRCACSTGADCEWLIADAPGEVEHWLPAPKNLTLYPGRFRGAGCRAKACFETFNREYPGSSMPESCR